MATTITINGTVTLDESSGLQIGIPNPVTGEDNNDSDVLLGTLQSTVAAFSNRLFNSVATGGLGLSTTFATSNGVAESASNFITVSGGAVDSLGFVDGNGGTLPVYSSGVDPLTGVLVTGFTALNGGAIHLFMDATSGSGLGNRMVLGVDTTGNIVFAAFMDPNAALTSARVWMVQFEAISNPNLVNPGPDDSVNLFDTIGVAASTSLAFDFSALHSGANLFGTVGDVNNALIVIGKNPVIAADGTFVSNSSDTIKTSQGGGPTTIGVNSQMFDPTEGAYFTYVKNPDPNFLAGAPNGLSPTEANDADNILYTGGTNAATGASTSISQTQGNSPATMTITAFDIADSPQARDFVSGLGDGTPVNITSVTITHANGTTETETAGGPDTSNNISFASGIATVSGLGSGDTIAWTTSAPHDRVLIEDVAGKFDIGGFKINQASSASVDIGQQLTFEDDGPSIGPIANSIVDFTSGATGTATKSLVGVVGTDQNATPYTIDSFTTDITINGTALKGVATNSSQTITYWADTSGDNVFGDAGDTAFYKLQLSETANSGAGSYTFTVLVDPPPAELNFDFSALHSGANLFGTVGNVDDALIVIGKNPVIAADGTFVSNSSDTIKTSQGGGPTTIGVNSQMFDPTEGAYFTYVTQPNPDFLAGAPNGLSPTEANDADNIQYQGLLEATSASTTISQTQGNSPATMTITAYDIAGPLGTDPTQGRDFVSGLGSGSSVNITSVTITHANGTTESETAGGTNTSNNISFANGIATVSGLGSGDKIAWTTSAPHDRVLIQDVAGKFDIGALSITQGQPTPDQKLDFVARATDGDGDFKTASFSIGIDGTGINHDGHVVGVG